MRAPSAFSMRARSLDPGLLRDHAKTWGLTAVLVPLAVYCVVTRADYGLMDAADLVIHEAGHFIFRWFGEFVMFAGGSLMQLLLPAIIAGHFFLHDYAPGTQLGLFWLGQSACNVSVYAADAQERSLPLLGGDAVYHDWWWMLSRTGLLHLDDAFGMAFVVFACAVFAVMALVPWRVG